MFKVTKFIFMKKISEWITPLRKFFINFIVLWLPIGTRLEMYRVSDYVVVISLVIQTLEVVLELSMGLWATRESYYIWTKKM